MEFRILGPLEAVEHGLSLPLGAGKQRALLALLLLHRGEVVPAERLIDELWGEHAPPTAAKSVQVYVSQLRKALGDGLLETRGGGYVLRLDPEQLDVDRFERLLERGRELLAAGDAHAASKALSAALALRRGPPLAELAYEPFAQPVVARLEELLLAALEERIEADLALGRHREVVPELEHLVRESPLRERLRSQLMLALYRSGRQADALEVYRDGRRLLVEELGLEPSRSLQELERKILTQDPALEPPGAAGPIPRALQKWPRRRVFPIGLTGALLVAGVAVAALVGLFPGGRSAEVVVAPNSVAVIDPETNRVVGSVPVGDGPTRIAVGAGKVWVLNRDARTISLLDPRTRTLVKSFAVAATPAGLAVGADRVWVSDSSTSSVVEVHPAGAVVLRTLAAPPLTPPPLRRERPDAGAIAHWANDVWFLSGNATLSRLDPRSGRVIATIRYAGFPAHDPAYLAVGEGAVWVSGAGGGVTRVDPRTNSSSELGTLPAGGPIAVGFGSVWVISTQGGLLWHVGSSGTSGVYFPVGMIAVGGHPLDVAVGEGSVWVANGNGTVARIDPALGRVVERIRVGGSLGGIAVGEGAVWVAVD